MRDAGRYMMEHLPASAVAFVRAAKGCNLTTTARGGNIWISGRHRGERAWATAHPRMVQVLRRQAAYPLHVSNLYHHPYQGPLARSWRGGRAWTACFFTNSGTEAVEGALKAGAGGGAQSRRKRERRASWRWRTPFTEGPWARFR